MIYGPKPAIPVHGPSDIALDSLEPEYIHPKDQLYNDWRLINSSNFTKIRLCPGCRQEKLNHLPRKNSPQCNNYDQNSDYSFHSTNNHNKNSCISRCSVRQGCELRSIGNDQDKNFGQPNCAQCIWKKSSRTRAQKLDHNQALLRQCCSHLSRTSNEWIVQSNRIYQAPTKCNECVTRANTEDRLTSARLMKRWSSEDSSLFLKSDSGMGKSDSSDTKDSPRGRRVSISDSTEILYDTPFDVGTKGQNLTRKKLPRRQPLKSALKNTGYLRRIDVEKGFKRIQFPSPIRQLDSDPDIYDPSLPYIPLEDEHPSLDSTVLSQFSEGSSESKSSGVFTSRTSSSTPSSKDYSAAGGIASINLSLDEWHEALEATAKLGWTLILYLAIRSHYKPIAFARLLFQGSRDFVRAVADYVTREPTLLSFRKGDVIKVTNNEMQYGDKGWLHGMLDGRSGMFPVEYVTQIGRSEARLATKSERIDSEIIHQSEKRSSRENTRSPERVATSPGTGSGGERISPTTWTKGSPQPPHDDSGHSSGGEGTGPGPAEDGPKPSLDDGKHSLFQFALQHFRFAKESGFADGSLAIQKAKKKKGPKDGSEWTYKDFVEYVKFSQSPLKVSLLSLDGELNTLSVETFTAIMRYMGDFPMDPQHTEVHCVYTILMNCHKHGALRDEVYCQVMKQTTNNKSSVPESCQRGWRLFSIIAAYFTCSEILKKYLLKYLETNAYDKRRAFHGTAMVCLSNIRKTFRYGGRKNVPSIEEITAITAGRNSKRQIYRLPGGTERVINTKSTSVVQDIIEELCAMINVRSQQEQEEFSLYCIVEGDSFTMPLAREEYVLDVTTELLKNKQIFYLIFCRSVYYYPLRLDNALYIEVVFNQIAPDYLAGLLLVTPGEHLNQDIVYDIAKIAALMHRAADLDHLPTIKEVKFLLPKPILTSRDVKPPQWVNLVQGSWPEVSTLSSMEAKASVLEILQNWELFGSAFFAVERVTEPEESVHTILALNKKGVHFLDPVTHETIITFTLDKIMSTRKVKGNDGELYLDMKCGNLMKPRIITLRATQAHEISRQIRQYITIEQRHNGANRGDNPKDVTLSR